MRVKKEENEEEDLLMLEDLSDKLTIQITRPDSETSTLGKGKEREVEEIEIVSDSSQDLINSPLTPRTPGGLSDRIKNELVEILEEVVKRIIDVKEEREIEKMHFIEILV